MPVIHPLPPPGESSMHACMVLEGRRILQLHLTRLGLRAGMPGFLGDPSHRHR